MKLKDTGLTFQDIKDKVDKYMIETYERFDFLAETAKDQYMYDENGTPYLDFYEGIAVKVVAAVNDLVLVFMHTITTLTPFRRLCWQKKSALPLAWTRSFIRTPVQKPTKR